jgi:hypothetical protein
MNWVKTCGCVVNLKLSQGKVVVGQIETDKCKWCFSDKAYRTKLVNEVAEIQERKNNGWARSDSFTNSFYAVRNKE